MNPNASLAADLQALYDRIRRQPALAREMDVSLLAQEVAGRWREHSDMIQASEEVPVAAWIVRKKVEGLVRPDKPEPETEGFDPGLRPVWLEEAVGHLKDQAVVGEAFLSRERESLKRPPAPVKDPSVWKLNWSYPMLTPKKAPPVQTVAPGPEPLEHQMRRLMSRLAQQKSLVLQEELNGKPKDQWVASFLAVVHLWHVQTLNATQSEPFRAIALTIAGGGEKP